MHILNIGRLRNLINDIVVSAGHYFGEFDNLVREINAAGLKGHATYCECHIRPIRLKEARLLWGIQNIFVELRARPR